MTALKFKFIERFAAAPDAGYARGEHECQPRAALLQYIPIATAMVVAIVSAATLTAFDKPLDRQALTPSVVEFMEASGVQPVSMPADNGPAAHAMLLRYDLNSDNGPSTLWQSGRSPAHTGKRLQPALL